MSRWFRTFASLLGMSAAMLTWVIGFRIGQHESFFSTTLALLIGLGGVLQAYDRHWRWAWSLEAAALPIGFGLNPISPYFPLPAVLIVASLMMVTFASLAARADAVKKAASDEAEGMHREKQ